MHEDASFLSIVRRIKAIPKQEEGWKCNSIFRTIVLNVVSKATNRTTSKIIQGSVDK